MSDQAEDQDGTTDGAAEAQVEPEPEATEAQIEPEPEPEVTAAQIESESEPDGARSRRPSSLRAAATLPVFPGSPEFPGSDVRAPVSATAEPGSSGEVSGSGPSLRQRLPLGKLPLNKLPLNKLPSAKLPTGKLRVDKLSAAKPPVDKDAADKLRTLVKQRPELGLGIAFAGGLVIATILKRLGRR